MKRSAWILLTLVLIASTARADIIDGASSTCEQLQKLVTQKGRVDIQGRFAFGTYVSSPDLCYPEEFVGDGIVFGTKDQTFCEVGYSCGTNNTGGNGIRPNR